MKPSYSETCSNPTTLYIDLNSKKSREKSQNVSNGDKVFSVVAEEPGD